MIREPLFRDQPDYTADLRPPSLADMARLTVDRYLRGDPPMTDADFAREARDPVSWRRFTIRRTRWRIEREHEAQRTEMLADLEREMLGLPLSGPSEPRWLGEGDLPWGDEDDD